MRKNIYSLLGEGVIRHKGKILLVVLLFSICPLLLLSHLEIRTDYAELISQDSGQQRKFNLYLKNFGASEALYVLIQGDHPDRIADEVYPKLLKLRDSQGKKLVKKVRYKIDVDFLYDYGLVLAPKKDFEKAEKELQKEGPSLQKIASCRDLAELFDFFSASMKASAQKFEIDPSPEEKAFLGEFLDHLNQSLQGKKATLPPSLKQERTFSLHGVDEKGYFTLQKIHPSAHQTKNVFMQIFPTTTADDYEPLKAFLQGVEKVFQPFKKDGKTTIAFSGSPKLTVDEIEDSNKDMMVLSIISLVGVGLIFIFFFGRLLWPLLGMAVLGLAILWTFGVAVVVFGYLNIISIVFAVVLVGLGVDFGIHFIERYGEILCANKDMEPPQAAKEAILKSGVAITTSALTTAAAFYISAFSGFKGSYQLGILAGTGILICMVFMLGLLPGVLLLLEKYKKTSRTEVERSSKSLVIQGVIRLIQYPKVVVIFTLGLALWASFSPVSFDSNLLNLQKEDSEAVQNEKRLMEEYGLSSRFAIILQEKLDLEKMYKLVEKLKKVPSVNGKKLESLASLLPAHQTERLQRIARLKESFSQTAPLSLAPPSQKKLVKALEKFYDRCDDLASQASQGGKGQWTDYLSALAEQCDGLLEKLRSPAYGSLLPRINQYQELILNHFRGLLKKALRVVQAKKMTMETMPANLKDYFLSPSGMNALYIYPSIDVRKPENLRRFVAELQKIDPDVTGPCPQTYEVIQEMKEGYIRAGAIALFVVFLILLLEFRSFYIALLAIIPLGLGALIMVGFMGRFAMAFNPANLMALPLLFGVGVDNSIHILHRYFQEGEKDLDYIVKFTGKAILVTSLTTGLSFGCLALGPVINYGGNFLGLGSLVAGHRGLSSLGAVMSLGVLSCLFTSMIFLPCLLKILPFRKTEKKNEDEKITEDKKIK